MYYIREQTDRIEEQIILNLHHPWWPGGEGQVHTIRTESYAAHILHNRNRVASTGVQTTWKTEWEDIVNY